MDEYDKANKENDRGKVGMDTIDKYVYAVTKNMPDKQRRDVSRELRSEIEAMATHRAGGKNVKDTHIRTVLMELGDPDVFAEQYGEQKNFLIGPKYFGVYIRLLKTLISIVVPIVVVLVLISGVMNAGSIVKVAVDTIGAGSMVGIHIFFWLTIIFAIAERSTMEVNTKEMEIDKKKAWTPEQLEALPKQNAIAKSETVSGIVWSVIAVLLVVWQIPAIHEAVSPHVPLFFSGSMWPFWTLLLLAVSVGSLIVEIVRFLKGTWSRMVVVLLTAINSLVILYFIALAVFVRPVVNEKYTNELVNITQNTAMEDVALTAMSLVILSIIVFAAYEIAAAWYKYKRSREEA